jgi:hypothetical protein
MSDRPAKGDTQDPAGEVDLAGLHRSLGLLYSGRALTRSVPAEPATFRARTGARIVRMVRRALLLVVPELDTFHASVIEFAKQQISVTTKLLDHATALDEEIYQLQAYGGQSTSAEGPQEPVWEMSPQLWMETVKRRASNESA